MHVEEENGNHAHGDQRSHPAYNEHHTDAQHCSNQTQPHRIKLESRPPTYHNAMHTTALLNIRSYIIIIITIIPFV